jgi:hypothetical protein
MPESQKNDSDVPDDGEKIICVRCGATEVQDAETEERHADYWMAIRDLFKGAPRHGDMFDAICLSCLNDVFPLIVNMADARLVSVYAERLMRAVYEKRKSDNNGRASDAACPSNPRCAEWYAGD